MPALLRQSSANQMNRIVNQIHKEIGKDIGEETAHIGAHSAKLVAIRNPITPKIDTYEKFLKRDNMRSTRAIKSKYVNRKFGKGKTNESRLITDLDTKDIKLAGNSPYPVGTKIKFRDDGKELTGTLTHPFGFCQGDVGVYVDQKGIFQDDKCCLRNREYTVDDPEIMAQAKDFRKLKTFKKFDL